MGRQASKEYHAEYRRKNREKRREWNREWIASNRDRYNAQKGLYRERVKRKVLAHYSLGDQPACCECGYSDVDALVLDHVNDDGAEHRRKLGVSSRSQGGGHRMYEALHAKGMPDDVELQTLCANCNTKKEVQKKREKRMENTYFAQRYREEVIGSVRD